MKFINLLICAILIVCIKGAIAADQKEISTTKKKIIGTRIVGGKTTTINNVRYILYLRVDGRFSCGCSLVTPRKVVIAAHCVDGVSPSRLTVHGGTTYLSNAGLKRAVIKVDISPNFSMRTMTSDVAVLTLASNMTGPNITTIGLCSSKLKPGDTVKVSGWGFTNPNKESVSNQLRTVNVKMIPKSTCRQKFLGRAILTRTMMCATVPGGRKDACSGDSGGPLVYNGQLCGIVSWGIGCASSTSPGVYTSVNKVKTFLNKHINN